VYSVHNVVKIKHLNHCIMLCLLLYYACLTLIKTSPLLINKDFGQRGAVSVDLKKYQNAQNK